MRSGPDDGYVRKVAQGPPRIEHIFEYMFDLWVCQNHALLMTRKSGALSLSRFAQHGKATTAE